MDHLQQIATSSIGMLKTDNEIKGLNKNEAQNYSVKLTNSYKQLLESLFNKESGIIVKMQNQIAEQQKINAMLMAKMELLEKNQIATDQYSRKETIEIHGIDENLPDNETEDKVIEMLNAIKENEDPAFTKEDIHACHKLKNKKVVICKFVSRRRMRSSINNRKKLKNKDLSGIGIRGKVVIYESMSFHYKNLHWRCTQLKKAGIIKDSWFYNGKYKIRVGDNEPVVVTDVGDVSFQIGTSIEDIDITCEEWKEKKFPPRAPRAD